MKEENELELAQRTIEVLGAMLSSNQWRPIRKEVEFAIGEVKNAFLSSLLGKDGSRTDAPIVVRILEENVMMDIIKIHIMKYARTADNL